MTISCVVCGKKFVTVRERVIFGRKYCSQGCYQVARYSGFNPKKIGKSYKEMTQVILPRGNDGMVIAGEKKVIPVKKITHQEWT